eukprot:SAG31_NODE_4173_length_3509_cov_58.704985_3_plen_49_part_00
MFEEGDAICITAKDDQAGWWTGFVEGAPEHVAIFPANFMKSKANQAES